MCYRWCPRHDRRMRIAVYGDVSGHLGPFLAGLAHMGIVPGEPWPNEVAVVQVGDLVHKGPDSDAIVAMVAALATAAGPQRWVQLAGNHEAVHTGGVAFLCDGVAPATAATLRRWHADGFLRAAVAVHPTDERPPWLITHAGLTRPWWVALGAQKRASAVADTLNELFARDPEAFTAGLMMAGFGASPDPVEASPLWAHPTGELWPSWAADPSPPFSQVHGHASAYWWAKRCWSTPAPPPTLAAVARVDARARRVHLPLGGNAELVGIDPGYGRWASRPLLPFVVHGELVL